MTLILNGTDNSATTPAVTGTDTDTGVYYPAANQVAIATSGTQAMLANASQGVQFANAIGVGATTPTTSGAGVTFPATQSASSDANTLDDYEEGTFTPALPAGSTGVSYTYRAGKYTKIGNVVYIHVAVQISAVTSVPGGAGSEFLGGLPFTSVSGATNYPKLCTQWNGCDWGGTVGVAQVNPSSTAITGTGCTNNAGFVDSLPSSIWDSAGNWVTVTGFYYVS